MANRLIFILNLLYQVFKIHFVTKAMPITNINGKCHKKAVELAHPVINASFHVNGYNSLGGRHTHIRTTSQTKETRHVLNTNN